MDEYGCVGRNWENEHFSKNAETRDRTGDLQIFSLTLPQLSYRGCAMHGAALIVVNLGWQGRFEAQSALDAQFGLLSFGRFQPFGGLILPLCVDQSENYLVG